VTYALGLELTPDVVRMASMSDPTSLDRAVEDHPPVLFCDAGSTWAGRDALEQGAGREQGFVNDIVHGFTVDRLFLTAGRLLTPDQAMRELIWGLACRPARKRQEWPGAVTVSCPTTWPAAALTRAESVVGGLGLQRPRVVSGYEAASAAADAFARLPADRPVAAIEPLPDLQSSFQPDLARADRPPEVVPHRTAIHSSRTPVIASLVAIFALVAVLGLVLLHNRGASVPPTPNPLTSGNPVVTTR
jgi:hypothetical protein